MEAMTLDEVKAEMLRWNDYLTDMQINKPHWFRESEQYKSVRANWLKYRQRYYQIMDRHTED